MVHVGDAAGVARFPEDDDLPGSGHCAGIRDCRVSINSFPVPVSRRVPELNTSVLVGWFLQLCVLLTFLDPPFLLPSQHLHPHVHHGLGQRLCLSTRHGCSAQMSSAGARPRHTIWRLFFEPLLGSSIQRLVLVVSAIYRFGVIPGVCTVLGLTVSMQMFMFSSVSDLVNFLGCFPRAG